MQERQPTSRSAWAGLGPGWHMKGRRKLYVQALVSYHKHCALENEASLQKEWATEDSDNSSNPKRAQWNLTWGSMMFKCDGKQLSQASKAQNSEGNHVYLFHTRGRSVWSILTLQKWRRVSPFRTGLKDTSGSSHDAHQTTQIQAGFDVCRLSWRGQTVSFITWFSQAGKRRCSCWHILDPFLPYWQTNCVKKW